jgi:hypothetical protein
MPSGFRHRIRCSRDRLKAPGGCRWCRLDSRQLARGRVDGHQGERGMRHLLESAMMGEWSGSRSLTRKDSIF